MIQIIVEGRTFLVPEKALLWQEAVIILSKNEAVIATWKKNCAQTLRTIPHLPQRLRYPEELKTFLVAKKFCCEEIVFLAQPV